MQSIYISKWNNVHKKSIQGSWSVHVHILCRAEHIKFLFGQDREGKWKLCGGKLWRRRIDRSDSQKRWTSSSEEEIMVRKNAPNNWIFSSVAFGALVQESSRKSRSKEANNFYVKALFRRFERISEEWWWKYRAEQLLRIHVTRAEWRPQLRAGLTNLKPSA